MEDDLKQLQEAEQKLLEAIRLAQTVLTKMEQGDRQELGALCESFVDNITESQLAVLRVAEKHREELPYEHSAYVARLGLMAAEAEAAEQQGAAAAAAQAAAETAQGAPPSG